MKLTLAEVVAVLVGIVDRGNACLDDRWADPEVGLLSALDALRVLLLRIPADAELFDEERLARALFDQWAQGHIKFVRDATAEGVAAAILAALAPETPTA